MSWRAPGGLPVFFWLSGDRLVLSDHTALLLPVLPGRPRVLSRSASLQSRPRSERMSDAWSPVHRRASRETLWSICKPDGSTDGDTLHASSSGVVSCSVLMQEDHLTLSLSPVSGIHLIQQQCEEACAVTRARAHVMSACTCSCAEPCCAAAAVSAALHLAMKQRHEWSLRHGGTSASAGPGCLRTSSHLAAYSCAAAAASSARALPDLAARFAGAQSSNSTPARASTAILPYTVCCRLIQLME